MLKMKQHHVEYAEENLGCRLSNRNLFFLFIIFFLLQVEGYRRLAVVCFEAQGCGNGLVRDAGSDSPMAKVCSKSYQYRRAGWKLRLFQTQEPGSHWLPGFTQ